MACKPGCYSHTLEWRLELSRRNNTWTQKQLDTLRAWYAERNGKRLELDLLVPLLGHNKQYVCRKARSLGLTNQRRKTGRKRRAKWNTAEERRAALSRSRQEWHKAHPHPRGMLGKKHSVEHCRAQSERNRTLAAQGKHPWQKPRTEEQRMAASARMAERLRTADANVYSSARRGYRADLGPHFFRSRWEANYARYLKLLVAQKVITDWEFEPDTFWFEKIKRGARSYTPDFKVWRPDTSHYYVEVKGWMDKKSATKIRRMARYHPTVELQVFGQKEYNEIERKLGGAIPHWEFAKSNEPVYTKEQMIEMGLITLERLEG